MGRLIGGFLFIFGLIYLLTGSGITFIGQLLAGNLTVTLMNIGWLISNGTGFVLMTVGLLFWIGSGIISQKRRSLAQKVYEQGLPAEGTVSFVDKNYSMLVNNKPIYSIVEVQFTDGGGLRHTIIKRDASSDLVIRLKIEVCSKIQVKYMSDDPDQNVILFPDPSSLAVT